MTDTKTELDTELIVHIGTGKTGSSSIQKTLAAARVNLRKAQTAYFGLMGEHAPVRLFDWQRAGAWPEWVALGDEAARTQLTELLLASMRDWQRGGIRRVIWSNESIFGRDALIIPILRSLRERGVRVKVIVYIRRHDAWAQSAYLQWGIKDKTLTGPIKPFREWVRHRKVEFMPELRPWLDEKWDGLAVRNFDACSDVVADFLECHGLHECGVVVRRENETPNPVALALWALHNTQFDEPVLPHQLQGLLKRAGLLDREVRAVDWEMLAPTQADIDEVRDSAVGDRAALNEIFRQFQQPEVPTDPIKVKRLDVSQAQINAALLLMLKRQDEQIQWLKKQLAGLGPNKDGPTRAEQN